MPSDSWTSVRLGDVARIEHGWPFKSNCFSEELTGLPIVVAIGNFDYSGGFRFDSTTIKEYRGEYPRRYELSPGDVVVVMTCQTPGGEILGIPARVPDDGRTYLHNQRIGKVVVTRPDLVTADFLYWVFLWSELNRELVASSSGTKIVHTAPARIEAFRFELPPISEQSRIAELLWGLERKRQLNHQLNRTLEATAAALFQSWFVDFDPVAAKAGGRRATGVPPNVHTLMPAAFVGRDSERVPEGWCTRRLGDIIALNYGKSLPERIRRAGPVPVFGSDGQTGWHDEALVSGPGIVVGRKGNAGRVNWSHGDFFPIDTTYFVELRDTDLPMVYVFYALQNLDLQTLVGDSAVPGLNREIAYSLDMIIPPQEIALAFARLAAPIRDMIAANQVESRTLTALRDALLPSFLSGSIRLREAEHAVAAM